MLLFSFYQAAIEEGVVVGGGCCLLRLSTKIDSVREGLDNEEQRVIPLSFLYLLVIKLRHSEMLSFIFSLYCVSVKLNF